MALDQCRVVDGCAPAVRRQGAPSVVGQCRKQESNKIVSRRRLCGVKIGFVEKKLFVIVVRATITRVIICKRNYDSFCQTQFHATAKIHNGNRYSTVAQTTTERFIDAICCRFLRLHERRNAAMQFVYNHKVRG